MLGLLGSVRHSASGREGSRSLRAVLLTKVLMDVSYADVVIIDLRFFSTVDDVVFCGCVSKDTLYSVV